MMALAVWKGMVGGGRIDVKGFLRFTITVEAALSDGFLFMGRDGCLRDLAGIHGTYRRVEETLPAVEQIGRFLAERSIFDVLPV